MYKVDVISGLQHCGGIPSAYLWNRVKSSVLPDLCAAANWRQDISKGVYLAANISIGTIRSHCADEF